MTELLHPLFSTVCGQSLEHTWSPGGLTLPLCQRCTGVYTGACVAALLHLTAWPQATYRWRCWHGAFLLAMVPFGLHWLPQGPILRSCTGVLFGFGVTAFLRLPLPQPRWRSGRPSGPAYVYVTGLLATLVLVPYLGEKGNVLVARTLTYLAATGVLTLLGLALANAALALRWLLHRVVNRTSRVVK